jgi:5-methylcytosine-specific restriction endonuclease McrA
MRYSEHNVLVGNPHPHSLAALVLLTRQLAPKPMGYRVWLKYRKWYIRKHLKSHRELKCSYCGKGSLRKQSNNTDNLATLDHVIPVSKGGKKFCSSNIVIACHFCNSRKRDMDAEKFKNRSYN